jgi:hypothetical protein
VGAKAGGKTMRKLFMVMVVALAGASVGAAAPTPAETWSCWHSISGDKDGASPIVLVRDGNAFRVRGSEFREYTILQDNEFGLVVARGYAQKIDNAEDLGADVLVIDKKTREIRISTIAVKGEREDDGRRRGKCEAQ